MQKYKYLWVIISNLDTNPNLPLSKLFRFISPKYRFLVQKVATAVGITKQTERTVMIKHISSI